MHQAPRFLSQHGALPIWLITTLVLIIIAAFAGILLYTKYGNLKPAQNQEAAVSPTPSGLAKSTTNTSTCDNAGATVFYSFEEALKEPEKVCHLILSEKVNSIPRQIGQMTNLLTLNLPVGEITELPPEIRNLINLQALIINNSKLRTLPPEIGQLRHLQWLMLDNNELLSLPPEVAELKELKNVSLKNNLLPEGEKETIRRYLPGVPIAF